MNIPELLAKANAPERALKACLEKRSLPAHAGYAQALGEITNNLGKGAFTCLIGGRGVGKTVMGVDAMGYALTKDRSVAYTTTTRFLMEVQATWEKGGGSTLGVVDGYRRAKLLVIDEFGKRSEKPWQDSIIFELLDGRYQDMSDTVLISNQSQADLEKALGPSLCSRMVETGGVILCGWETFRK